MVNNERFLTVFDGPNREQLMDVFRMQYLRGKAAPYITFKVMIHGKKQKVGFHPVSVEYEDESGDWFSVKGKLFFLKGDPKKKVDHGSYYTVGSFSTKSRNGSLKIIGD